MAEVDSEEDKIAVVGHSGIRPDTDIRLMARPRTPTITAHTMTICQVTFSPLLMDAHPQGDDIALLKDLQRNHGEWATIRRYQTLKEGEYWSPADEQQFESNEAGHLVYLVVDSQTPNPLFQAPVTKPKVRIFSDWVHILDVGTGRGTWAIDVADSFPNATVRGVDLYPPPETWLPPNCIMEVDDVLQEWTWRDPFDLIHLRQMMGSFTPEEWGKFYKQCYEKLTPGGWIEQLEGNPRVRCDDASVPDDNHSLYFGKLCCEAADNWGRPITWADQMKEELQKAGFVDIHEKNYKWPIGPWPKDPILKEAGRLHYHQWTSGMEGWAMFFLTKYGVPKPWTNDEAQILMAKVRKEIFNSRHHFYQVAKRVWARKPTAEEAAALKNKNKDRPEEAETSREPEIKQERDSV
ncbi:hypothetical protein N7532_007052 [Penicillium argentinense]|uniref:S-adenosyl-L-methionine-dependent methyltransferase n=1 Tax=Penicillium argentinense TaxID=1131581 RepID=A0A9W9KBV7_9EURO|nr:uncharacterized protein N7532_007052 [Penicillium argentinense]KAJ5100051.1 hypothetical protein N7532_007052 [Penicillium argentinense]